MTHTVRRLLVVGALAGGLGLALPAAARAADPVAPKVSIAGGVTTMELTSTQTRSMFVPKGGTPTADFPADDPPAAGDAFTFTESLHQGDVLVGGDEGTCTIESFGVLTCRVIATFADGTVTSTARIAEDAEGPNVFDLVSGTGAYTGIDGRASVVDVDESRSTITLRYTLPQTTQVGAVPVGAAATGGGAPAGSTDSALLIGVGIAARAGAAGLFGAAQHAARRS